MIPAIKPQSPKIAVNITNKRRTILNAYPSSKLGCVKFPMATKAKNKMLSWSNSPAPTANSPKINAPTTLKELDKLEGVFNEASLSPSLSVQISVFAPIPGVLPLPLQRQIEAIPVRHQDIS